jgi:V/A-type H+-transporting ATPase subunit I
VLENEKAVGPYQFLTTSFSFPNANEIDPSIIYFFTVPLLYGMIVADVVYGTISIFLALFFMKKFKDSEIMSSVSRLWLFSAIPAILFGVVFDEFAGMTHYHLLEKLSEWGVINAHAMGITGPLYTGLSRLQDLTMLFQVTLLVGMIHIALGLVMGAINEWGHSKKHALGKLAWIGVQVGGYLAVATFMFNAMPVSWGEAGAGLLVLSALVIAWVEGVVGVLELPGIASNVFSYVRIAVVGVVGTILAELINAIFMPAPTQGVMALIFFPLFIGLHILNAFIAMFEAVIQGGRLNIIEFKLKFLKGGGRPFRPFALSEHKI